MKVRVLFSVTSLVCLVPAIVLTLINSEVHDIYFALIAGILYTVGAVYFFCVFVNSDTSSTERKRIRYSVAVTAGIVVSAFTSVMVFRCQTNPNARGLASLANLFALGYVFAPFVALLAVPVLIIVIIVSAVHLRNDVPQGNDKELPIHIETE